MLEILNTILAIIFGIAATTIAAWIAVGTILLIGVWIGENAPRWCLGAYAMLLAFGALCIII